MKRLIFALLSLLIISVGLLPVAFLWNPAVAEPVITNDDARRGELTQFMQRHRFAKPYYVDEYLEAADKNQLDWRVLPAIAVLESSGCVHLLYNNCFGWNSARTGFGSIPDGISFVAGQLAGGTYYRGKTLEQKIKTYNSVNPAYWPNLQKLMKEMQ